jgi:hypothetical protein
VDLVEGRLAGPQAMRQLGPGAVAFDADSRRIAQTRGQRASREAAVAVFRDQVDGGERPQQPVQRGRVAIRRLCQLLGRLNAVAQQLDEPQLVGRQQGARRLVTENQLADGGRIGGDGRFIVCHLPTRSGMMRLGLGRRQCNPT